MRVCVTGGSGFVGSQVVAACLDAGHEVVATVRDARDARKTAPLDALASRGPLAIVTADLLQPGSFDEALRGCQALLHVAGVASPTTSEPQEVIRPALDGLRNVLAAAARAGTVRRVVLTSSVVAMGTYRQASVRPPTSPTGTTRFVPSAPLRLRQDAARAFGHRADPGLRELGARLPAPDAGAWPGAVSCPYPGQPAADCRSAAAELSGESALVLWPGRCPRCRRCACRGAAAGRPWALPAMWRGRWLTEIAAQLQAELPSRRIATATLPTLLLYAAALLHPRLSLRAVRESIGLRPQYDDSTRAQRELGLQFRPLDQTVRDTAQSLLPYL